MAALALFATFGPQTRRALKVHAALLCTFLIAPLLAEGALRICIAGNIANLRNAKLFADSLSDNDHWKLRKLWKGTARVAPDPLFGWSTPKTAKNPLGVIRLHGYEPQTKNVVLCFGDSFMEGVTPFPHKIPDQLEERLEEQTVYNYGVGGYGVGQMYLRFLADHSQYVDPTIVVGIMTRDLDRSILSVRGSPKPRFRVTGGKLALEKFDSSLDAESWRTNNPPTIRSYLLAMAIQRWRRLAAGGNVMELDYRREEKQQVNRAIIAGFIDEARAHDLRLLFVILPTSKNVERTGWRTEFLRETFKEFKVPFVDGGKALRADMRKTSRKSELYFLPDNHPNEMGNGVFADAIAERIVKLLK
ncbi:MAG: hypothetical protein ACI8X5_002897 [Planctomycetota bacterium]|jgi:hypothetical protein